MERAQAISGSELMTEFVKHSPFAQHLSLRLTEIEPDRAVLVLPYQDSLPTYGDTVHGGAISTLIDAAATVAAWSAVTVSRAPQGATVALTTLFMRAARGTDLTAEARVVRRGRSISYCDVDVLDADETLIAKGSAVYKIN